METLTAKLGIPTKGVYALVALFIFGIALVLFIGNRQLASLNANPLPITNRAAIEQCLSDLRSQHIDVSGAKSLVCQGKQYEFRSF